MLRVESEFKKTKTKQILVLCQFFVGSLCSEISSDMQHWAPSIPETESSSASILLGALFPRPQIFLNFTILKANFMFSLK